jgi:asparagine synthase (glutamine-hydrolysing)
MKLLLVHNKGFKWTSDQNLSVIGYAFVPDGRLLENLELCHYLLHLVPDGDKLKLALKQINGIFSFIYISDVEVFMYCDKSRFFPLFWRMLPELMISDEPTNLISENSSLNETAVNEFRYTGYSTGTSTLIKDVQQVAASEFIYIDKLGKIDSSCLFSYRTQPNELHYESDPALGMNKIFERAATRLKQSIGDAIPVLPLSGGFDSRLIACILKDSGYNNVICFTFGRKTPEVSISEKVAKILGFKWYFIDYEKFDIRDDFLEDKDFNAYFHFAARLTSMFYLQEYLAVKYLREQSLIPENSVFLPGHSGDLLGGSQFVKVFPPKLRRYQVIKQIFHSKYTYFPVKGADAVICKKRIRQSLGDYSGYMPYSVFEDWDVREKIAKFIINSSNVFTFFGFQVRFFFWDEELVEYFRCLPPEFKKYKKLYDQCLKYYFFDRHRVSFGNELGASPLVIFIQKFKNMVKALLPKRVRYRYIIRNDWAYYEKYTGIMMKDIDGSLKKHLPYNNLNSVLINWYLTRVKKLLPEN